MDIAPHYFLSPEGKELFLLGLRGEAAPVKNTAPHRSERLALVDRDGVVVVKAPAHHYHLAPDDIILLPGAAQAIRLLNERGTAVALATNQPGIGAGQLSLLVFAQMAARLTDLLAAQGARLDAVFFCPHAKGAGCGCRKPAPGLITAARRLFAAPREHTVLYGDAVNDITAAQAAGIGAVFIATSHDEGPEWDQAIREQYPEIYRQKFPTLLAAVAGESSGMPQPGSGA